MIRSALILAVMPIAWVFLISEKALEILDEIIQEGFDKVFKDK